jgi:4-amino-4-deoxy-L-arabinose transferase-like glycosyltransferase
LIAPSVILLRLRNRFWVDARSSPWILSWAAIGLFATAMSTSASAPLFDPDEGFYPGTAAESVDAGAAWDPRFNGERRWDKPILTYALIEASFAVFGRTVPAARFPIAAQGATLLLLAGFLVHRLAGPRAAALSAVILATTLGVQVFSRVAHPEFGVVMYITITELLAVLWIATPRPSARLSITILAGAATGLGVLTKGPVAIVLPALTIGMAGLIRNGIRLPSREVVGHLALAAAVALAVAAPWYLAMTRRHGMAFLQEAVWRHNVSRFAGTAFVHESRPWFFVVPTFVAMFPWSAFVPLAVWAAWRQTKGPRGILRLYMASAAITAFVFYSASASRLPHYSLAFVPSLAILIALVLADDPECRAVRMAYRATAIAMALVAGLLGAAPFLIDRIVGAREILNALPDASHLTSTFAEAFWPGAVLLAVSSLVLWQAGPARRYAALAATGGLLPLALILGAQPLTTQAYPWGRFGRQVHDDPAPVYLVGPRAPSLTFYAGRPVSRLSESEATLYLWPHRDLWVVASNGWLRPEYVPAEWTGRFQIVDQSGSMTLARLRFHSPRHD